MFLKVSLLVNCLTLSVRLTCGNNPNSSSQVQLFTPFVSNNKMNISMYNFFQNKLII